MTYAIFDHKAIGASLRKASSLKTEPNTVNAKVYVPPKFDDYGMYAGWATPIEGSIFDTAPSEYCPPDFDPA